MRAHHRTALLVAQAARDRQRGDRGGDRDRRRGGQPAGLVVDAGRHLHGRHAGVVHAGDAAAHQRAADGQVGMGGQRARGEEQREAGHHDRQRQRIAGVEHVVAERDRQGKGQHRDEVHRPDAGAHRHRAAGQPGMTLRRTAEQGDAARQVERCVRGQRRHHERDHHQEEIVRAVHVEKTEAGACASVGGTRPPHPARERRLEANGAGTSPAARGRRPSIIASARGESAAIVTAAHIPGDWKAVPKACRQ